MLKDTIKQGILAGLLGSLGDMVVHWTAFFVLGTSTTAHYIAQLVFPHKEPTITRLLTGVAVHLCAGAFVGIVLIMVFRYFGSDHPYYKGLGLAAVMWIIHIAIIPNIVSPRPYIFRTELESLVDLIAHMAYGTIATMYWLKTTERPAAIVPKT
jgi:hypothetical protein